jgi:hypothetical protein
MASVITQPLQAVKELHAAHSGAASSLEEFKGQFQALIAGKQVRCEGFNI